MLKFSLCVWLSFGLTICGFPQTPLAWELRLHDIEERSQSEFLKQQATLKDLVFKNKLRPSFSDDFGNHIRLTGFDPLGWPEYTTTLNAGAALTTGVTKMRAGGILGLNLLGEGMKVGVWDESLVKDHMEFGNRLNVRQGNYLAAHATHVTGTIIASGLDPLSRGMAPKAAASTWDFENDIAEMASVARSDQSGLILSNHSYSILLGFYFSGGGWVWAGNPAISIIEDYRFGFYNEKAKWLDEIAYASPYYTIVWAAGNERANSGDGSYPPDGNGGTGYDCLNPESSSKNTIAIGAVHKVANYTGPGSVSMSAFSSWGPTDDGRIKPDLVAAGVSIYSTSTSSGADTYATFQGTSMAAPNASGTLLLLQELNKRLYGHFMKAATLKGLAIHTAKEAGLYDGPDYQFGWGVLDGAAASKLITRADCEGYKMVENSLANGYVFSHQIEALGSSKITATLAWTDPPGTVPVPQLDPTNLMLIHDLDILIYDELGNVYKPWVLNPKDVSAAATKGNNIRDNVEKIEFIAPTTGVYTVLVSHKGVLTTPSQDYSMILTYTSSNAGNELYWIGGSGNWNDPAHWSISSGGTSSGQIPSLTTRVIVDENSFPVANPQIELAGPSACRSMIWLSSTKASLSFNNYSLKIDRSLLFSSDSIAIPTYGEIQLINSDSLDFNINLKGNDFSKIKLMIDGESSWKNLENVHLREIQVLRGQLILDNTAVKCERISTSSDNLVFVSVIGTVLSGITNADLNGTYLNLLSSVESEIHLAGSEEAVLVWHDIDFKGTLFTEYDASLFGNNKIYQIRASGVLTLAGENTVTNFHANAGAVIHVQSGTTQTFLGELTMDANPSQRITLDAQGLGSVTFSFEGHFKQCFDYIDIDGVAIEGDVTLNAGMNSTLVESPNWFYGDCENALFANFEFKYNCSQSLTQFTSTSEGNPVSWYWDFGDGGVPQNQMLGEIVQHSYASAGTFDVTLTVSDGVAVQKIVRSIPVRSNSFVSNKVLFVNGKLTSKQIAPSYQWFKNGDKIEEETNRFYDYQGEKGAYYVILEDSKCVSVSPVFVVTGLEQDTQLDFKLFPNPVDDFLIVESDVVQVPFRFRIFNAMGQEVFSEDCWSAQNRFDLSHISKGVYYVSLQGQKQKLVIN